MKLLKLRESGNYAYMKHIDLYKVVSLPRRYIVWVQVAIQQNKVIRI